MSSPRIPLYEAPGLEGPGMPVLGLASAVSPFGMMPGEWVRAKNMRASARAFKVRAGTPKVSSSVPAAATLRGEWHGKLNGTRYIIVALAIGSETYIYSVDPTTFAYTELSAGSATYYGAGTGNTRFATETADVTFAAVRAPNGYAFDDRDLLVIQNGADNPMIYDPQAAAGHRIVIHEPVLQPTDLQLAHKVMATFTRYMLVSGATRPVYTNTAGITLADTGTSPDNMITLTVTAGVATNNTARGAWAASTAFLGRQLVMGVDSASLATFLANIRVEYAPDVAGAPGTWQTVYDAKSTASPWLRDYKASAMNGTRTLLAFPLDNIATSGGLRVAQHVRFTWLGAAPATTHVLTIWMIANGGSVPGLSRWGFSYGDEYTHVEGPAVFPPGYVGENVGNLGGPTNLGAIPEAAGIFYDYAFNFPTSGVSGATITGGLNGYPQGIDFYLKQPGDPDYYWLTGYNFWSPVLVGGTDPGWSNNAGSAVRMVTWLTSTHTESFGLRTLETSRRLTDASTKPIPIAKCQLAANGRLVVGNTIENSNTSRGDVWFSEDSNPFRFRRSLRFLAPNVPDSLSATRFTLQGEEVLNMAAVSGQLLGIQTIMFVTNQGLWAVSGVDAYQLSRPTRLAPLGTSMPLSLAESRGEMFWVDSDRQLRKFGNRGLETLSLQTVEDKLLAGTLTGGNGVVWQDRYYLGYQASGSAARTDALVWDFRAGIFLEDSISAVAGANFGRFFVEDNRLLFLTTTGDIYEHEKSGQTVDQGLTGVAIDLLSGFLHRTGVATMFAGRAAIVCDDANSTTLTTTRTYRPNGQVGTASMNLDGALPVRAVFSGEPTPTDAALEQVGSHVQFGFTGTVPGGMGIYNLFMEVEPREELVLHS